MFIGVILCIRCPNYIYSQLFITSRRRVAVAKPTPPVNSCVIISSGPTTSMSRPRGGWSRETEKTLKTFGVDPMVITSDTHADHVKAGIIEFMNHAEDAGEILLITWNAYVDLPYLNRRENWRVIIDEVPQVDRFYPWICHAIFSSSPNKSISKKARGNDRVARVIVKDRAVLEELFEAQRDDVQEVFREFFRDLLSHNKDMFVDLDSWNRLVEQGEFTDDESLNRLFFISMLRPEAFSDAILLGANVRDSLVYHWLTRFHGYRFVEHGAIASQLRRFPEKHGFTFEDFLFHSTTPCQQDALQKDGDHRRQSPR